MQSVKLLYDNRRRRKGFWCSEYMEKRGTHGEFVLTNELSDSRFRNYCRLTRNQFEEVHSMSEEEISLEGCNAQKPIGTREKLAIFLSILHVLLHFFRYLATGDSYRSLAYSYRMGDQTVSKMYQLRYGIVCNQFVYLNQQFTERAAQEFKQKWHFLHCIESVDNRHIIMKNVPNADSVFNYKGTFFTVLMATVDVNYKFTSIDVGSYGRLNDSTILRSSVLGDALHCKTLPIPPPAECSGFTYLLHYIFVGDKAFPLMENLTRPYPRCRVTSNMNNKVFNYRLSRACQTVECAFGIMASKFRVFRKPFEIKLETIDCIVKAVVFCITIHELIPCLVRHNYATTSQYAAGLTPDSYQGRGRKSEDGKKRKGCSPTAEIVTRCRATYIRVPTTHSRAAKHRAGACPEAQPTQGSVCIEEVLAQKTNRGPTIEATTFQI
ncbi:hypothetical protein PR048_001652 [Dryococelus australis]|uniref:DDE Tnp4 domain-containing protein n=1 Tax=Dryococelus australis TaxID=614101 RepID=A0ABQ9IHY6_9NEOP|nr:hypothetical protein PR048_001652 [Dryococelus australis]